MVFKLYLVFFGVILKNWDGIVVHPAFRLDYVQL